jgi:hypothetical protein
MYFYFNYIYFLIIYRRNRFFHLTKKKIKNWTSFSHVWNSIILDMLQIRTDWNSPNVRLKSLCIIYIKLKTYIKLITQHLKVLTMKQVSKTDICFPWDGWSCFFVPLSSGSKISHSGFYRPLFINICVINILYWYLSQELI